MRVVAVTGMPGAGKELAAEVAFERGWPVVRMGDLVRDETRRRHETPDPEHVAATATALRRERGPGAWADVLLPRLHELEREGTGCALVDGVRNAAEVEVLRRAFGTRFVLVAVEATDAVRRRRIIARARQDDVPTEAWLEERDRREVGYGLGEVLALADHRVPNESSMEEFQRAFSDLLDRLEGA